MISFGFEGSFVVNGFEVGAVFRGLSKTGRIETFFLAGTETKAGAGTEAEAGVALAVEIAGIVRTVGMAETEAEAGTETEAGVALGMEAFSCARLNKNSR
jgi:hypothetical protein